MSELRQVGSGRSPFDAIKHVRGDGTEWWSAREMMGPMGYRHWEGMENVVKRAKSACRNSGFDPRDHFREVPKYFEFGRVGRPASDVHITRYGCYLLAMNGDPDKSEVAAAQRYFAMMTRMAELQAATTATPSSPTPVRRGWLDRYNETMLPHICHVNINHPGCFTVVSTLACQLLYLEYELVRHMLQPMPSDRPDVSIGKCWANDRRDRGLPDVERFAPLDLSEQKIKVMIRVYSNAERGDCEAWFARTYLPSKLPVYLANKPEFKTFGELPPASVADQTCRTLAGVQAQLRPRVRRQLSAAGGFFPVGAKLPALEFRQRSLFESLG